MNQASTSLYQTTAKNSRLLAIYQKTKIVYKVPSLAQADEAGLSESEKDLRRYMQIILPLGESAAEYLNVVRDWDCVEEAQTAPEISLPQQFF